MRRLVRLVACLFSTLPTYALDFPDIVPAVHSATISTSQTAFSLPAQLNVVVAEADAHTRDTDGLTLIPPTLLEFAKTFAADLHELFPNTAVHFVSESRQQDGALVTFSLLPPSDAARFKLSNNQTTSEGYRLEVGSRSVAIKGAGARGAFWATRTFLQGLILNGGTFPASVVEDHPDWGTRGFMLGQQENVKQS